MRIKDESKKEAIFNATISLLNEIGFYQISMSKIAKRAGVSVATIYVYFEDKDDMIRKLYLDVKGRFVSFIAQDLDINKTIQQNVEHAITKTLKFIVEQKEDFLFLEQFSNSPLVRNLFIEENFESIGTFFAIFDAGKRDGTLKQVDNDLLMSFCYYPVAQLAKSFFDGKIELSETVIKTIATMGWDAIRA